MSDDAADPLGQRDAAMAERLDQIAKLQMAMSVDQRRQHHLLATVPPANARTRVAADMQNLLSVRDHPNVPPWLIERIDHPTEPPSQRPGIRGIARC